MNGRRKLVERNVCLTEWGKFQWGYIRTEHLWWRLLPFSACSHIGNTPCCTCKAATKGMQLDAGIIDVRALQMLSSKCQSV